MVVVIHNLQAIFAIDTLRSLLIRENLNSTFSASYTDMAITFDVLNRFQENKVFQAAQIMNNIPRSSKKWYFCHHGNRDLLN